MHGKSCCDQFQTEGGYGRHLRSKHPEVTAASAAVQAELLQYYQDIGRVQQNSPEQSRQKSGRRRK